MSDATTASMAPKVSSTAIRVPAALRKTLDSDWFLKYIASGMAAIMAMFVTLLKTGDHVVCSDSVFGTTITMLNRYLSKFGVETTFVPLPARTHSLNAAVDVQRTLNPSSPSGSSPSTSSWDTDECPGPARQ